MIRGIHHVALHTPSFDAMRRFYRDAFGFVQVGEERRWADSPLGDQVIGVNGSSGRMVTLKAQNCYMELFEFFTPAPRDAGPARPNDYGYTHFCVEVTDIDAEFERLKSLGMTFTLTRPADYGFAKTAYGRDPDGNVIEIQQVSKDDVTAFERLALVVSKEKAV